MVRIECLQSVYLFQGYPSVRRGFSFDARRLCISISFKLLEECVFSLLFHGYYGRLTRHYVCEIL
jgi:hypothetical protein